MRPSVLMARFGLAVLAATTLLAADMAASPQGSAVRPVGALSAAELQTLPASTKVQFNHKTVTLGQLRAAHAARQARFDNAAALGARSQGASHKKTVAYIPMPASALAGYAKDYQDFCRASKATGCLYLPTGVYLILDQAGVATDSDPLITSGAVCASGGGKYNRSLFGTFCSYSYPTSYLGNFVTTATKAGIHCDKKIFQATFDPHGAVHLTATLQSNAHSVVIIKAKEAAEHCTVFVAAR